MDDERLELVRVDATGTAHPVGKTASQRLRARQGAFRLMPAPQHLIVMRYVGEDGKRDADDGPVFRLSGEITALGALCDIVSLVGQAGWKGELVVFAGAQARSVFFDDGKVIGASSNVEGERLGEVLYRYGALTEEQVEAASRAVTPDMRFGEATVKLGFLSREKLFSLMSKQTEAIVYAVLLVGDGMFYFLETYDEKRISVRQNLSVSGLLMEGVRRMDETRYFRDRIPSAEHVPARVPNRMPPEPELDAVFSAVDGQRSVAEICRVCEQGEFDVTQALFQLVQAGLVVIHAPRPTGPAAVVALQNEAMALLFRELAAIDKKDVVREQLASFATGAGIYDALFQKAGPAEDGTLAPDRIVENVAMLAGPEQAETMLAQWLYEYVSFALFVAEPFLRASEGANAAGAGSPIQRKVADLIAPLAPKN
jgi:hypothetical protein